MFVEHEWAIHAIVLALALAVALIVALFHLWPGVALTTALGVALFQLWPGVVLMTELGAALFTSGLALRSRERSRARCFLRSIFALAIS